MKCTTLTFLEVVSFPQCNDPVFQKCISVWKILKHRFKHSATLHLSHLYLVLEYFSLAVHMWCYKPIPSTAQC